MPKNAKNSKGPGRRGTGSHKSKKTHKLGLRSSFLERHIDQVWEDVRATATVHDGKVGPIGTTDKCARKHLSPPQLGQAPQTQCPY